MTLRTFEMWRNVRIRELEDTLEKLDLNAQLLYGEKKIPIEDPRFKELWDDYEKHIKRLNKHCYTLAKLLDVHMVASRGTKVFHDQLREIMKDLESEDV